MTQKFFDRFLLILSIICFLIILQIKFFHIPLNWFGISLVNMEKTNDIIFNLSTNIIAGYIFYVINIQIVSYFRQKKTRKLIDDYLIDFVTQMNVGQLYLKETYFKDRNFESLDISDFRELTTLKDTEISFKYKQVNTIGEKRDYSTGTLTERDLFEQEREMAKSNIQVIFSFPYISTVDYELINLLHKIQSSFFYIGVKRINLDEKYTSFNKHFFDHYENYKALIKFIKPRETTL